MHDLQLLSECWRAVVIYVRANAGAAVSLMRIRVIASVVLETMDMAFVVYAMLDVSRCFMSSNIIWFCDETVSLSGNPRVLSVTDNNPRVAI